MIFLKKDSSEYDDIDIDIDIFVLMVLIMMTTDRVKHHSLVVEFVYPTYRNLLTTGRYLAWRNARTVSNFFYTSHMVCDYFDTLMQDLNKVLSN